jgi:acetylcholinesterase
MHILNSSFPANFAYRLDPNYNALASNGSTVTSALANVTWSQYSPSSPLMLTFEDPDILTLTPDTYRASQMNLINTLETEFGF